MYSYAHGLFHKKCPICILMKTLTLLCSSGFSEAPGHIYTPGDERYICTES